MRYMRMTVTSLILLSIGHCVAAPLVPATRPESPPAIVHPGDRLKISIFEWKTPGIFHSIEIDVDKEGKVDLPDLGKIPVAGLTTVQIESTIFKVVVDHFAGSFVSRDIGPEVKAEILTRLASTASATATRPQSPPTSQTK